MMERDGRESAKDEVRSEETVVESGAASVEEGARAIPGFGE